MIDKYISICKLNLKYKQHLLIYPEYTFLKRSVIQMGPLGHYGSIAQPVLKAYKQYQVNGELTLVRPEDHNAHKGVRSN